MPFAANERVHKPDLRNGGVSGDPLRIRPAHPCARDFHSFEKTLTDRISKLEAALFERTPGVLQQPKPPDETPFEARPPETVMPMGVPPIGPDLRAVPTTPLAPSQLSARTIKADQIESVIGRRWVGWAAVCLILFAAAFFLKYAFDNRWIGELGRVAIGVAAGVGMTVGGFKYHKRGWRIFSQILTGGGVVLLYLSAYAAFGYYHLASQKAAFAYLAILVAEAALLAFLYNAPAIAIMALVGGFLTPILLHTDRDQYRSLFGYIVRARSWRIGTAQALAGTCVRCFCRDPPAVLALVRRTIIIRESFWR